ncbi:hypothetical protein [Cellulomonas sp. Marseille-Q8402]
MITRDRERMLWARASRDLPLDADAAWHLVADARHHARWVPLTRVDLTRHAPGAPASGWTIWPGGAAPEEGDDVVAVSGPFARQGAPGLVDRMRIERFEPPLGAVPGVAVFVKLGPLLLGTARIEVEPTGLTTSRVTWSETVHLRGLRPGATRWAGVALVDQMLRLVLRRAGREADRLATQRSAA